MHMYPILSVNNYKTKLLFIFSYAKSIKKSLTYLSTLLCVLWCIMVPIALGASVPCTCILDSSYSFFEGGGPWLVGDVRLGWAGSGGAAALWAPPPNWRGKQNNEG